MGALMEGGGGLGLAGCLGLAPISPPPLHTPSAPGDPPSVCSWSPADPTSAWALTHAGHVS